ncbi:MAG: transketolase [Candidatus Peregrinibacteria bacterium]
MISPQRAKAQHDRTEASFSGDIDLAMLCSLSNEIRRMVVTMAHRARSAHVGSALSMVDILAALYFRSLKIDPLRSRDSGRDRFILSKGHGAMGLYATLALRGFFPVEELSTFGSDGGRLPGHPCSHVLPGVEYSSGSLGHGLSVGLGMALAAKLNGENHRTVVLLSDGECDEGSTWEAVLAAGHWKMPRLTAIVDYNKIQSFGRTADIMDLEPFAEKWRAFQWHIQEIDGHDHQAILSALECADQESVMPSVIIAHTVKGKGIPAIENTVDSHYRPPTDEHLRKVLEDFS